MTSKKFTSGSPLGAIRDSRWLNFVNEGSEIAHRISYEGGDITTGDQRTNVLVKNSSGAARDRFDILGIADILISPSANEKEFLNHFALDADAPDENRDGPGRIAVLQTPLGVGKIGPAVLWGMTPVKIDLPDGATYTAANIIAGDATKLQADDGGDIVVVWHETGPGVKWALVNLGGGSSGNGGTTITDGCECATESNLEGTALTGSPTVCCISHERWRIDLGEVLGVKILYHVGGDIWSTFNADEALDNPVSIECYPDADEYDLVLELTSTGATITFEARAALNCDAVCFEYVKAGPFNCQRANEFRLSKFSGIADLDLPLCLCIRPLHPRTEVPECADCTKASPTNIIRPQYIRVTIDTVSQCCINQQYCENFNGSWVFQLQDACGTSYGRHCIDIIGSDCDGNNPGGCLRYIITATYGQGGATVRVNQCGFTCGDPDCPPSDTSDPGGWGGSIGACGGASTDHIFSYSAPEPTPWDEVCSKIFQWTEDEWFETGTFGTDCDPPGIRCGLTTITVEALGNVDLPAPTEDGGCTPCGGA